MILYGLGMVFLSILNLVLLPLRIFSDVVLPEGINNAIASSSSYLSYVNLYIDVSVLISVVSFCLYIWVSISLIKVIKLIFGK